MGVNVEKEYRQFEQEMEWYRREYLAAGLTEEDFRLLYEFCKAQLARDIAYQRHAQALSVENDEDPGQDTDGTNPLFLKFSENLCCEQVPSESSRYWWIDEISSEDILKGIFSLSDFELDLIDLYVYQGLNQKEIAHLLGKTQGYIAQRLIKIRKILKTFRKH